MPKSTAAWQPTDIPRQRSLRAVLVLTGLSVGVLIATAPAIGAFFSLLDARRGDGAASTEAITALPGTLAAYAPGLVGLGLTALLTRAVYVRGRPADAALAAAFGWSIAALLPLVVIGGGQDPATTLRVLGLSSTLGMTLSGVALVLLVRRTWGPAATQGTGRTSGALVVAAAAAVMVGSLVTHGRPLDDLVEVLVVGAAAGAAALFTGVVVLSIGDFARMSEVVQRGRARRRRKDPA